METCWFCKNETASPEAAEIVKMYGEIKRGDPNNYLVVKTTQVQYATCAITIPRCKACKNKDTRTRLIGILALVCCLGIAYLVMSYGFGLAGALSYVLIAALAAALWVASIILSLFVSPSHRASNRSSASKANFYNYFPPLWELVQKGWKMGDRPV
jgi:hypothetical protein